MKNVLVLAAPLAAGAIPGTDTFALSDLTCDLHIVIAFVVFCLTRRRHQVCC